MIFDGDGQTFPKFPKHLYNVSKNNLEMKLFFYMQINIKISWEVYFNTLGIKVSFKLILSLLMGIIKHYQSTQINKFAIPLQYLKKVVMDGVHFLHLDKH